MHLNFKKIVLILVIAALGGFSFSANSIHAQSSCPVGDYDPTCTTSGSGSNSAVSVPYTLLTPLPDLQNPGNSIASISLEQFIPYAYKFLLALAVVLAVFMITIGGFEYVLSGAMETKSDAKKKITDAVLGLLLALCTYIILYTIDPNLVSSNNLTLPPIGSTGLCGSGDYDPTCSSNTTPPPISKTIGNNTTLLQNYQVNQQGSNSGNPIPSTASSPGQSLPGSPSGVPVF